MFTNLIRIKFKNVYVFSVSSWVWRPECHSRKKTHIEKQRKCNNKLQHAKMNPCYYHNRSSIFLNEIITFSTEWWSCRQRQPSQRGSTQGATCILHSRFSSPCRSIHRIRQSTGGNPARKQEIVKKNLYNVEGTLWPFSCKYSKWQNKWWYMSKSTCVKSSWQILHHPLRTCPVSAGTQTTNHLTNDQPVLPIVQQPPTP